MVPDHILPARHRPKAPLFCDAHEVVVDLIVLFGIALGLAMDAFAVSIAISVALGGTSRRQTFRLAWHFGLFQALMPIIGWIAGRSVRPLIESWDHWLAFALLTIVGGRMILEAVRGDDHDGRSLRSHPRVVVGGAVDRHQHRRAGDRTQLCRPRGRGLAPGRGDRSDGRRLDSCRHSRREGPWATDSDPGWRSSGASS